MDYLISVSFGELTLKGDNRKDFENRIIRKIKKARPPQARLRAT